MPKYKRAIKTNQFFSITKAYQQWILGLRTLSKIQEWLMKSPQNIVRVIDEEEISSAGNMQRNELNFMRKRSDSNNCHQCHNKDKENVLQTRRRGFRTSCLPSPS